MKLHSDFSDGKFVDLSFDKALELREEVVVLTPSS